MSTELFVMILHFCFTFFTKRYTLTAER